MIVHNIIERHIQDQQERQIMALREFYNETMTGMRVVNAPRNRPTAIVRTAPPAPVRVYRVNGRRPF